MIAEVIDNDIKIREFSIKGVVIGEVISSKVIAMTC